jgi:hypothetical protein
MWQRNLLTLAAGSALVVWLLLLCSRPTGDVASGDVACMSWGMLRRRAAGASKNEVEDSASWSLLAKPRRIHGPVARGPAAHRPTTSTATRWQSTARVSEEPIETADLCVSRSTKELSRSAPARQALSQARAAPQSPWRHWRRALPQPLGRARPARRGCHAMAVVGGS